MLGEWMSLFGRVVAAMIGAGVFAAWNIDRYVAASSGGDDLWPSGPALVAVLVAMGVTVGRWWAVAIALTFAITEVGLAMAAVDPPDGLPPPLDKPLDVAGGTIAFALLIAVGVGARKVTQRLVAPPPIAPELPRLPQRPRSSPK